MDKKIFILIIVPILLNPAFDKYCGICVDFPHPVSPAIMTTLYSFTALMISFLNQKKK
jgi:hypothetical protein